MHRALSAAQIIAQLRGNDDLRAPFVAPTPLSAYLLRGIFLLVLGVRDLAVGAES